MSNQSKFQHIEQFCPKSVDKKSSIISWNPPSLEFESNPLDPYLTERPATQTYRPAMNPQYAEVHRILGQTESDRQLSILNKALQTYLPDIKNDSELGEFTMVSQPIRLILVDFF